MLVVPFLLNMFNFQLENSVNIMCQVRKESPLTLTTIHFILTVIHLSFSISFLSPDNLSHSNDFKYSLKNKVNKFYNESTIFVLVGLPAPLGCLTDISDLTCLIPTPAPVKWHYNLLDSFPKQKSWCALIPPFPLPLDQSIIVLLDSVFSVGFRSIVSFHGSANIWV